MEFGRLIVASNSRDFTPAISHFEWLIVEITWKIFILWQCCCCSDFHSCIFVSKILAKYVKRSSSIHLYQIEYLGHVMRKRKVFWRSFKSFQSREILQSRRMKPYFSHTSSWMYIFIFEFYLRLNNHLLR